MNTGKCLYTFIILLLATLPAYGEDIDALFVAVNSNNVVALKKLVNNEGQLDVRDEYGQTLLSRAMEKGHNDVALFLIRKNIDVNAMIHGIPVYFAAIKKKCDRQIFSELEKKKVNYQLVDENTKTSGLKYAVFIGSADCVNFLLTKNIDVNSQDISGHTALHDAVLIKNIDIVKALLKKGARKDIPDKKGLTAIDFVKTIDKKSEVYKLLMEGGDLS